MDQLARLVTVFDQEGAQQLIKSLKDVQTNSKGAETATEQLTDATKKGGAAAKTYSTGVDQMSAHLVAYQNHLKSVKVANDNAAKSMNVARYAGLNLGRNLADVGVQASMGMNPLMILIQQGPQIADAFQAASMAGVSFKAVLAGLYAQIAPIVVAFAPWIAGLAAVAGGVWLVVNAQQKHNEEMAKLNKAIATQKDGLEQSVPSLILNADNANLAAIGQKNFESWLQKTNGALETQISLLRNATLMKFNKESLEAASNLARAREELTRIDNRRQNPSVGGFSGNAIIDPNRSPSATRPNAALTAQQKVVSDAAEASRLAVERLNKALTVTKGLEREVFGGVSPSGGGSARARGGGGARGGATGVGASSDNSRGLRGVAGLTVDPSTVVDLNDLKPVKGIQENGLKTVEDDAKRLADSQQKMRDERVRGEQEMWSNLISLSGSSNKKLAAIGKAAAIAHATMDGINAVQKAWASAPFPFNLPAVAITTASTVANVAAIAGVGFAAGGYTGNGGIGQEAGVVHGQEFVVNAAATRQNRAMLEAMNAGRAIPKNPANGNSRGGTRVTVVKGDLFDAIIEERATSVAAPMADRARQEGAQQGAATANDMYVRQNMRRLF